MSKFKFIMAADPQYEWGPDKDDSVGMGSGGEWKGLPGITKENCWYYSDYSVLAKKQVESMNKLIAANPDIVGVMFNGDLVDYNEWKSVAEDMDLDGFKEIYSKIQKPMYCGLGNHDYDMNVDDSGDQLPPSDMVDFLISNIEANNVTNKDFLCVDSYEGASLCRTITGSLSYSFDIYNVHFVQLNNYPGFTVDWSSYISRYARRYRVTIKDCYDWLKADLNKARNEGKAIIVCQHQLWFDSDNQNIVSIREKYINLYNEYGVSAVFVGHEHKYFGAVRNYKNLKCPAFYCGATSQCNYILIEVDSETCKLKVQGVSSLDGNIEYVTEVAEIALNTETGTGEIINPPGFVTFFSEGGYTVEFTLKYKENGTTVEKKTGRMLLGNKTTYDLPAGASDYEVSCLAWNGSSWKEKFDTYKSDTPFNCTFRTYGALPNPKMEIIYD